ncbi:MAG: hypothetical protein ACE5EX_06395 [Phycisphaerae bacterium]
MKRHRLRSLLGGSATIAFTVGGIPIPGCEALVADPTAFFAENACSIFNCDTLFFLEGEHGEVPGDPNAAGP